MPKRALSHWPWTKKRDVRQTLWDISYADFLDRRCVSAFISVWHVPSASVKLKRSSKRSGAHLANGSWANGPSKGGSASHTPPWHNYLRMRPWCQVHGFAFLRFGLQASSLSGRFPSGFRNFYTRHQAHFTENFYTKKGPVLIENLKGVMFNSRSTPPKLRTPLAVLQSDVIWTLLPLNVDNAVCGVRRDLIESGNRNADNMDKLPSLGICVSSHFHNVVLSR